jgi:hypothetical protein
LLFKLSIQGSFSSIGTVLPPFISVDMMRKFLLFSMSGFALTAVLICLFGDFGLSSYRNLAEYRSRLEANVEELVSLNGELAGELEYLKRSPSATEVQAGDLGLYGQNDRVILLEGAASRRVSYDAGKLLRLPKRRENKNLAFKGLGVGAAAFLAFFAFLFRGFARKKAGRDYRRG